MFAAESKSLGNRVEEPPTALIGVGPDGLISLTAGAHAVLGYLDEELLGRPVQIIIDQPDLITDVLRADAGQTDGSATHAPCRRKDGTRFVAELHLATVQSHSGTQVWAQVREAPLSARAAATRSLHRWLADTASDAIISVTLDGQITYWNPAAERLYGYTRAEAVGRSIAMLYVTDPPSEMARLLEEVARGRPTVLGTVPRRRKDGMVVRVSVTFAPILDDDGAVVGGASITKDVEGEQRAEARFRALLEAATVAIVGVNESGRILMVNAEAERLFGHTRDELRDQPVEILVPHALRHAHEGLRGTFLREPKTRPMGAGMRLQAQRKDGSQFPVEVSLAAIDTDDGLLVAAAVRDLTQQVERERLEKQLQQSHQLESLGQLAGGVAHDINNLMAIIGGQAEFIRQEAETGTPTDLTEVLAEIAAQAQKIQGAVERTTDLTRQLLSVGRRELLNTQVLKVNEAVQGAATLLERTLGEHIAIDLRLADGAWPIMADPGQVEQMVINAAVNARDAMLAGGRLTLQTANMVLDGAEAEPLNLRPGRYVRLRMTDTGVGMPSETAAKAFEPFFTTKPPGEGTGLGLSTIYGIVVRHQGHVRLSSEIGHGTTLTILLPAHDGPVEQPGGPSPATASDGSHYTVLLVDDQDGVREVARRILQRQGHRVLEAADGSAALEVAAAEAGHIDLLLTDVIMPKMLGTELAKRLAAERPAMRVLFMSGYVEPALNEQGTLAEGAQLMEKPFTEQQLRAAVAVAMREATA
ncbi:PAS domain S-box protein [Actinoplanes sp. NBRC 103695]|uniref:PAS domain S-box protein n=1 Tax=Actinoplanes sp. NBRC 103695 TaxID=3032202 RepID=UPI0024A1B518|nr:PAS domain S-box protein [Actinoplanes sp. NBRC 103695]GLY99631.1 histidine kinase [Actinoplanes sp. NBRC 103695]